MSFLNTYSIALRFTMLLLFIVSFEKIGIAQNPLLCSNATDFLATNDSLPVYEQQTDSSKWYKFIAETNELELDVYAINSSSLNNFTQLILWEGNCNSLNQLAINSIENSADDVMNLSVNNLIIGNNYFVEILKPNNNAILNYSVALHFFSLNAVCTGNFGPPCEFVADGSFEKFIAIPQMQAV